MTITAMSLRALELAGNGASARAVHRTALANGYALTLKQIKTALVRGVGATFEPKRGWVRVL